MHADCRAYFTYERLNKLLFQQHAYRMVVNMFRSIRINDAILMPSNLIVVFDKRPHDRHKWVGIYRAENKMDVYKVQILKLISKILLGYNLSSQVQID
jgi:hypothetical protein